MTEKRDREGGEGEKMEQREGKEREREGVGEMTEQRKCKTDETHRNWQTR